MDPQNGNQSGEASNACSVTSAPGAYPGQLTQHQPQTKSLLFRGSGRGRARGVQIQNEDTVSVSPGLTGIHQQTSQGRGILNLQLYQNHHSHRPDHQMNERNSHDLHSRPGSYWDSGHSSQGNTQQAVRDIAAGLNQGQQHPRNNGGNEQYQHAADQHHRGSDQHHRAADYHHRGAGNYYAQKHSNRGDDNRSSNRHGNQRYDQNYGGYWNQSAGSSRQDNVNSDKQYRNRDNDDYYLSRFLSSILRHNAKKYGLSLMKGGFLYVDDILKLDKSFKDYSLKDVQRIVSSNEKQRFALKLDEESKKMMIRANQGHTLEVEDLDLTPVTSADEDEQILHGTYFSSWNIIKTAGLSKMKRNHIHFSVGEPGDSGVISGMRSSCEVIIYLDMKKCLEDGLKFYRSANNVILCSGDKHGVIYPCYFSAAVQRKPRQKLEFDRSITCAQKVSAEDNAKDMKKKKKKKNKNKEEKTEDNEKEMEDSVEAASAMMEEGGIKPNETSIKEDNFEVKGAESSMQSDGQVVENWDEVEEVHPAPAEDNGASASAAEDILRDVQIVDQSNCSRLMSTIDKCNPLVILFSGKELDKETGELKKMYVMSSPNAYSFGFTSETEGEFLEACKKNHLFDLEKRMKILHHCGNFSHYLFKKHGIILDGTPVFDSKIVFENLDGVVKEELIQEGFDPTGWMEEDKSGNDMEDNAALERSRLMLKMFKKISSMKSKVRNFNKEIYAEVNRCIGTNELKDAKKKLRKPVQQQLQQPPNQGKPSQKKNHGAGKGNFDKKGRKHKH